MEVLTVALPGREYDITVRRGILAQAGEVLRPLLPAGAKLLVVTDSQVEPLYGKKLTDSLESAGFLPQVFTVPAGETSKSMAHLERLYRTAADFGMTRTDAILALGGGVVGDLAGFAAATYLRGIAYIQVPTTLLAQVDSSVGGKTAIDLPEGKNLVGAFWQPRAVLMDPACLETLPDQAFAEGMAEVIKYGCIRDGEFFAFLEAHPDRAGVMAQIEAVLLRCCGIKAELVCRDERDTGARRLLNFGHTLGHAYELQGGYERWTHGQAVAAGMCTAAELGERLGITAPGTGERLQCLLRRWDLPTRIPCTQETYRQAIGLDKKGSGRQIAMILLSQIGHAQTVQLEKAALLEYL